MESIVTHTCLISGCSAAPSARGLCPHHYGQAYRRGDLEVVALPSKKPRKATDASDAPRAFDCEVHGKGVSVRLRSNKTGSVRASCRQCDRGSRSRGPKSKAARRARALWSKYGLTEMEYEVRLAAQGGRCLICRTDDGRLVVDHCHESGRVRGLLCHRCNVGLGWFNDSPSSLTRALQYIRSQ